jgi:chemotaxis protein CheX
MSAVCSTQIEEVAQCVFETMLDMRLTADIEDVGSERDDVLATIQITGAFMGSVILGLSNEAAKGAAAMMLNVPLEDVTQADERDVSAELVNMIGGNLKSLLPGPSLLSLPAVLDGRQTGFHVHGAELLETVRLVSDHGPLSVRVYAQLSA